MKEPVAINPDAKLILHINKQSGLLRVLYFFLN
jgi:hypothetical protein